MSGMRKERASRGFDQVAPAERVSRPLLPAPVKGQRSRHSGEGAAPSCGGAAVEQAGGTRMSAPVHTEATRSGSSRHLFKIGEPDPVPYLAPEVVRDAQVAWNALARLAFQMDTVQLEPQVGWCWTRRRR